MYSLVFDIIDFLAPWKSKTPKKKKKFDAGDARKLLFSIIYVC